VVNKSSESLGASDALSQRLSARAGDANGGAE
jgi:hypothetical protein